MYIDQQIAANEKTFQEWFQRSWDAHHKENPSATEFKDVGDPRPTTHQKSYDYLDKRTVRVMVDFQSRPDDFVQLLQDYLINNALLLYQDSIRIANLHGSVSFYKDCGDQVGMVECHLSREGQIVTVAIGYQTYKKSIALTVDPLFQVKQLDLQRQTAFETIDKELHLFDFRAIIKSILIAISFPTLAFVGYYSRGLLPDIVLGPLHIFGLLLSGPGVMFFAPNFFASKLKRKAKLKKQHLAHSTYDLSHTFFPVAYYSNEEVTAAQTQNKDHAAFLERIRSVIERAVAFGESSHNQRS